MLPCSCAHIFRGNVPLKSNLALLCKFIEVALLCKNRGKSSIHKFIQIHLDQPTVCLKSKLIDKCIIIKWILIVCIPRIWPYEEMLKWFTIKEFIFDHIHTQYTINIIWNTYNIILNTHIIIKSFETHYHHYLHPHNHYSGPSALSSPETSDIIWN
jgi:hypothetical protein